MVKLILILHLLGAAVWAGGHLVLALGVLPDALKRADPQPIRDFEARFERIGLPALLVQILTGLLLAYRYLPSLSDWFALDSHISTHIAAKLLLLLMTLALAVHARWRYVPHLQPGNLRALAVHIVAVTVLAVALVAVGVGLRTGGLF